MLSGTHCGGHWIAICSSENISSAPNQHTLLKISIQILQAEEEESGIG